MKFGFSLVFFLSGLGVIFGQSAENQFLQSWNLDKVSRVSGDEVLLQNEIVLTVTHC